MSDLVLTIVAGCFVLWGVVELAHWGEQRWRDSGERETAVEMRRLRRELDRYQ